MTLSTSQQGEKNEARALDGSLRRIDRNRWLRLTDQPTRNVLVAELDVCAKACGRRGTRLRLWLGEEVLRNPARERLGVDAEHRTSRPNRGRREEHEDQDQENDDREHAA